MDAEGKRAREQMKQLPFKEKLKNFWFYYKIHMAVAILAVLVFGTAVVQCVRQVDYDLTVMYFGCNQVDPARVEALEKFLNSHSVDVTDNGKVETVMPVYVGDINAEVKTAETSALLVKLQAEIVSNINPAFIMDKAFKNFVTFGYEGAYDKIIDLSLVPQVREMLNLKEGEELYWVSVAKGGNYKAPASGKDAFDNAERIEKWLEDNME